MFLFHHLKNLLVNLTSLNFFCLSSDFFHIINNLNIFIVFFQPKIEPKINVDDYVSSPEPVAFKSFLRKVFILV